MILGQSEAFNPLHLTWLLFTFWRETFGTDTQILGVRKWQQDACQMGIHTPEDFFDF